MVYMIAYRQLEPYPTAGPYPCKALRLKGKKGMKLHITLKAS
jgi:hypothetical protein